VCVVFECVCVGGGVCDVFVDVVCGLCGCVCVLWCMCFCGVCVWGVCVFVYFVKSNLKLILLCAASETCCNSLAFTLHHGVFRKLKTYLG